MVFDKANRILILRRTSPGLARDLVDFGSELPVTRQIQEAQKSTQKCS